jgi:hypothetical protein
MYINSIDDEVAKYKDSSRFKIKTMILIYRCLRFLNGDTYYFLLSLFMIIGPIMFVNYDFTALFLGIILHYFFFWVFLKDRLNKMFNTEREIREIDIIIQTLQDYLKKKNPN